MNADFADRNLMNNTFEIKVFLCPLAALREKTINFPQSRQGAKFYKKSIIQKFIGFNPRNPRRSAAKTS
jgi:hypothetical protein